MATIKRHDGEIVAWGGDVDGPYPVYSPMGTPLTLERYAVKIGVGEAELREFHVYITTLGSMELQRRAPQDKDAARKCVVRYVEDRCTNSWIPENNEHFVVQAEELIQLYAATTKATVR